MGSPKRHENQSGMEAGCFCIQLTLIDLGGTKCSVFIWRKFFSSVIIIFLYGWGWRPSEPILLKKVSASHISNEKLKHITVKDH